MAKLTRDDAEYALERKAEELRRAGLHTLLVRRLAPGERLEGERYAFAVFGYRAAKRASAGTSPRPLPRFLEVERDGRSIKVPLVVAVADEAAPE